MSALKKVVFVGGAPRSGTSITHALLCSAPEASRYHPEISFFRPIPMTYWFGLEQWDTHTHAFHKDREAFRQFVRGTALHWLSHIAGVLGDPAILCLKDPLLTPRFRELRQLLPDEAWFVTVCRHPFSVVRSRQQVHEKAGWQPAFDVGQVRRVAREYRSIYLSVLQTNFGGRHFMFRYEDLDRPHIHKGLAAILGVPGFDPHLLWRGADGELVAQPRGNPFDTPKYYGDLDLAPRLPSLPIEWQEIVSQICEPVMTAMGYTVDGPVAA